MSYTYAPGAGHRRIDDRTAATEEIASSFRGLPEDVSHRQVLTMFKRAAPYLGIPPRLVHVVDTLMSWSRPVDWTTGERPIVFPSNEKLSGKLGIGIRQLQKTLTSAARRGLIAHRDSPNGNRIGARGKDGRLIYAYGIDLSPLGVRYQEFVDAAEQGRAADVRVSVLRKRLSAARRRIRSFAQLVEDEAITGIDARLVVELSEMATRQMREVRDENRLMACVEQIESSAAELARAVTEAFASSGGALTDSHSSPSGEPEDAPITTTIQPENAKANYSSDLSKKSRGAEYDVRNERPQTEVEKDLKKHGIDPEFIAAVVPELIFFGGASPTWGELIGTAERLVNQTAIHKSVWDEACRLMGQKGAAASVIATAHKHSRGDVDRPGAYLRGMNKNAASGNLNLGRTFHGLKDSVRVEGMRALGTGGPCSIGQLALAALGRRGSIGRRLL